MENKELLNISKNNCFNAIRFICAIIVVIRHCFDLNLITDKYIYLFDSHVAVCIFFIFSGFWVTKSLICSKNVLDFYKKRIRKIFPLYIITILFFTFICSFYSNLSLLDFYRNIGVYKYLFWNIITLNFIAPNLPGVFVSNPYTSAINGALWTIKVELGFYIILPVIYYLYNKIKKQRIIFLIIIYFISIISNFIVQRYNKLLGIPISISHQLPFMLGYFIAGMITFLYWNKIYSKIYYFIFPSIIVMIIHYYIGYEFLFPFALSVLIVFVSMKFSFLNFIGKEKDYSYAIYLVHFPIVQICISEKLFNENFILICFFVICTSFSMAYFFENIISIFRRKK